MPANVGGGLAFTNTTIFVKGNPDMGHKIPIEQAAKELGISKRSLRRMISSGDLTAYRIGSLPQCVRIDVDDLETVCKPIVPTGKVSR